MKNQLLAGTTFGPYVIDSVIGSGGMGVVYRGRDPRLDRDVAIKTIQPEYCDSVERRRRFETEARSAARLAHPNVVAIYDVGEQNGTPYIVAELVEGGTLAGRIPLSAEEALPIAIAIAEALADAHQRGIVHRDLKPANILMTRGGIPKISDFGLAKCLEPVVSDAPTAMTREGVVMGTPAYMSPEQAAGRTVDFRSDIYSFGVILREMFHRNPGARVSAIINRCLAKDPAARYGNTADLVRDLRAAAVGRKPRWALVAAALAAMVVAAMLLRPRPTATQPISANAKIESLAILPLQNFSPDPAQSYFADAMTEELTAELSSLRSLRVISRTSASAYRGTKKSLRDVARELGADGLIEGSVTRTGDRARVTVQLIDGRTDRHIWAQTFDRQGADILALQRDVAAQIVEHVRATLSPAERARLLRVPTQNMDAYQAFLHAQYKLGTALAVEQDTNDAIRYAEDAVKLDPEFAEAHVALARGYVSKMFSWKGGKEYDEKAYIAVERALALNPSLPDAYIARGVLQYGRWRGYDIAGAVADYRRALALNPNSADAHQHLCGDFIHAGLHDEAIAECRTALRLDPQLKAAKQRLGRAQWQSNRFAGAIATYDRFGVGQAFEKAAALAYAGRLDEAHRVAEMEGGSLEVTADNASARALIAAMEHNPAEAAAQTRRSAKLGAGNPHFHHAATLLAAASAELGNAEDAVHWLSIAAETGMPNYPLFSNNPSLRKLRGNVVYEKFLASLKPRWEQIVAQVR